jgi:hypothetical protein
MVGQPGPGPEEALNLITRTNVTINVTPLFKQRNEVTCDIDPQQGYMKGGNITLSKAASYTLIFCLQPGNPANLQFQPNQGGTCAAFWTDTANCPTPNAQDGYYVNPRLDPTDPNNTTLLVDVNPPNVDYAVHYRLDFNNGCYFDPIIINH